MSRRKSILVLATTYPRWEGDSVPDFVHNLSKEIQGDQFDVTVLAPHAGGAKKWESLDGISVRRYPYFYPYGYQKLCYERGVLGAINSSFLAMLQVPLLVLSLFIHTIWMIRKNDIDLIHSHWLVPNGFVAATVGHLFSLPHVMTLHAGGLRGGTRVPGMKIIARYIHAHSDTIVPVSTHILESYQNLLDRNIDDDNFIIQPMGAHTNEFDTSKRGKFRQKMGLDDYSIGTYVGRLEPEKGIYSILEALSLTVIPDRKLQLRIVGSGSMEDELRDYVFDNDLNDTVEFTGWLEGDDLRREYLIADFVVIPSIESDSGVSEGMPTVIAEAFAASTPVVASDVGGIADVVEPGKNGLLVHQNSSDQLAEAISELVSNPDSRHRLSKGASETSEELDWERCGETYVDILNRAIAV